MKNLKVLLFLISAMGYEVAFSQDTDLEGCKDHPMFPNRMSNYLIGDCTNNYDAVEFNLAAGGLKMITKEGNKTSIQYNVNAEFANKKPSILQILRNYEAAAKKIGGVTVFLNAGEALGVFKIMKNNKEVAWVKIEGIGSDSNDSYVLSIVELEQMNQEITSNDILTALNTDGRISLYINFETGKSTIKPESQNIIDQIADLLKTNDDLKLSVEGHTDNVGTPASNKILSDSRANSVMNAVIAKGIDKSRLISKGWGQEKPIVSNDSDEGRAQNRRVEIVKL